MIDPETPRRRHDLDWLRVGAFLLLIAYHIGMFYVTWDWHVKSVYVSPVLEPAMRIVNPWRLALLFFISGVALRFASDRARSIPRFAVGRLHRLGLPILMGMVVIVAPQAYLELVSKGDVTEGFLAFWPHYLSVDQQFSIITPTWNHLWYVVYLLVYTLVLAPFMPALRRFAEGRGAAWIHGALGGPTRLILAVAIPAILIEVVLVPRFPITHALVDDWANHARGVLVFLLGYLVAKDAVFWSTVDRTWRIAAGIAAVIAALRLYVDVGNETAAAAWMAAHMIVGRIVAPLYAWCVILALLGFGHRYLNQGSPTLTYLTRAVFCYYCLHQTVIVVAGFVLTPWRLGAVTEGTLIAALTVGVCGAGYEVARRVPGLGPWFGVPPKGTRSSPALQGLREERLVAAPALGHLHGDRVHHHLDPPGCTGTGRRHHP